MPPSIKYTAISQRFRPGGLSSKSEHEDFEILATRCLHPQLFGVNGVGKISCCDSNRDWIENPVALTYPARYRGVEWNE